MIGGERDRSVRPGQLPRPDQGNCGRGLESVSVAGLTNADPQPYLSPDACGCNVRTQLKPDERHGFNAQSDWHRAHAVGQSRDLRHSPRGHDPIAVRWRFRLATKFKVFPKSRKWQGRQHLVVGHLRTVNQTGVPRLGTTLRRNLPRALQPCASRHSTDATGLGDTTVGSFEAGERGRIERGDSGRGSGLRNQ